MSARKKPATPKETTAVAKQAAVARKSTGVAKQAAVARTSTGVAKKAAVAKGATRASRAATTTARRDPGSRPAGAREPGVRHVAFLRAINVGGRTVTMDRLRAAFAGLPVRDVETFIASGNVLFTSDARDLAALERDIARALRAALGYEVETFVRTADEIAALARFEPFAGVAEGHKLHVGFLHAAPTAAAAARLAALGTDYDALAVHGRELWWWTKGNMSLSHIPNGAFDKALGMPTTLRNVTTVRRLAAKVE